MRGLNISLSRCQIPYGLALALIFCLAAYYALLSVLELTQFFQSVDTRETSYDIFNGIWSLTTSILCLCSIRLNRKKSKYFDPVFAGALTSLSTTVFYVYKRWISQKYSWIYSDWGIVGALIIVLFIWWLTDISRRERLDRTGGAEISSVNRPKGRASASAACLCFVCLVFSNIVVTGFLVLANRPFLNSHLGVVASYILSSLIFLAITICFSRVQTPRAFRDFFAFNAPNSRTVIAAILLGAVVAALAVYMVDVKLAAPRNGTAESIGPEHVWSFRLLLLLTPFTEEIVIRGFLYKALREDYSVRVSIFLILIITLFLHFGVIYSAPVGAVPLLALNAIVSLFREKTNSIWNCIICHFAYNCVCMFG